MFWLVAAPASDFDFGERSSTRDRPASRHQAMDVSVRIVVQLVHTECESVVPSVPLDVRGRWDGRLNAPLMRTPATHAQFRPTELLRRQPQKRTASWWRLPSAQPLPSAATKA
jgi:hypothetical protein